MKAGTLSITTDNEAHIQKIVTFSERIGPKEPFELSYRTRNRGLISVLNRGDVCSPKINQFLTTSQPRERRYDDTGDDVKFLFIPTAGSTHALDLLVYKGFDEGHRNLTCYLPGNTTYELPVKVKLDLTKYQTGDCILSEGPKLVFFSYDAKDLPRHERPDDYARESKGIDPQYSVTTWKWEWNISVPGTMGGVIYLYWEFS